MADAVGELDLVDALVKSLRTVPNLVSLTSYSATTNISISRSSQDIPSKLNFIGVDIEESVPLLKSYTTFLKKSLICITCISKSEITCLRMADEISAIFDVKDDALGNRAFYDFSDDILTVKNSIFYSAGNKQYNDKTDKWSKEVYILVLWIPEACTV